MDWNSSILWGIISLFSTIFFGLLFGYIFYKKGIKKKKLYVCINSNTLISEDLSNYDGLKILYNNEEIAALISSSIIITNIGNDLVEMDDIISTDPITISTSKKFLSNNIDTYTVTVSNKKVSASLQTINDSTLQLVFDFLRPKDKIKFTLLHTGTINIEGELKIGTIEKNIDYDQNTNSSTANFFNEILEAEIRIIKKISPYLIMVIILVYCFIFTFLLIYTLSYK